MTDTERIGELEKQVEGLAAERDKWKGLWEHIERREDELVTEQDQKIERLETQVRELTEERQQVVQIIGGKYAIGALPIYLQSIINEYHQLGEAVESFRERAVRAILKIDGLQRESLNRRTERIASLVESLPLEPEQKEKL